jgi:hypothetical protein
VIGFAPAPIHRAAGRPLDQKPPRLPPLDYGHSSRIRPVGGIIDASDNALATPAVILCPANQAQIPSPAEVRLDHNDAGISSIKPGTPVLDGVTCLGLGLGLGRGVDSARVVRRHLGILSTNRFHDIGPPSISDMS